MLFVSQRADLRKGKIKCYTTPVGERSENRPCRHTGQRKRRTGGAPGMEQKFPCGLWRGPWWSRLSLWSPWVPWQRRSLCCSPWWSPWWSRGIWPKGHWSRLWARAAAFGEEHMQEHVILWDLPPMLDQFAFELWTPWSIGAVLGSCCLWKAHTSSVWEKCNPVGGTPQRIKGRQWPQKSGGDSFMDQTQTSFPVPLCLLERGGRRRRKGEKVVLIFF